MSTGGEGGMLLTNNYQYYKKIFALKDGKNIDKIKKILLNLNFNGYMIPLEITRMTEMQAAIGIYQLQNLNKWVKKRNSFSLKINKVLNNFPYIRTTKISKNFYHSFYRCYFFLDFNKMRNKISRESLIFSLKKHNIECNVGSCPEIYLECI